MDGLIEIQDLPTFVWAIPPVRFERATRPAPLYSHTWSSQEGNAEKVSWLPTQPLQVSLSDPMKATRAAFVGSVGEDAVLGVEVLRGMHRAERMAVGVQGNPDLDFDPPGLGQPAQQVAAMLSDEVGGIPEGIRTQKNPRHGFIERFPSLNRIHVVGVKLSADDEAHHAAVRDEVGQPAAARLRAEEVKYPAMRS